MASRAGLGALRARVTGTVPRMAAMGQLRQASVISTPKLTDLESRFPDMSEAEQDELTLEVRERMKAPWNELSKAEKQAALYIAYGPYGPRAKQEWEQPGFKGKVFRGTLIGVLGSLGLFFFVHSLLPGPPRTMTREWQEAANERLKEYNAEPITGISSKGYKGKGQVQSP